MKCVINVNSGGICRVSNEEAKRLMYRGTQWNYIDKFTWKKQGRMTSIAAAEDYKGEKPVVDENSEEAKPVKKAKKTKKVSKKTE